MSTQELVVTLVFSIVLLGVMLYPSIKIADRIDKNYNLSQKRYLSIAIGLDILFSIIGGLFLSYF